MTVTSPLDIESVITLAIGSRVLFMGISFIVIAIMSAKWKMMNALFLMMFVLFAVMMFSFGYVPFYVSILILLSIALGKLASRVTKT